MQRQFPPELIQLIVKASLDPVSSIDSDNHRLRYAILKSYSRLNSTWFAISQPVLYESVILDSYRALEILLALTEEKGGEIRGVKEMKVSGLGTDSRGRLGNLLGCVGRDLERLSINNGSLQIAALPRMDGLRRLVTRTPALSLPSLRYLEMRQIFIQDPAAFFSIDFLPALVSLSLRRIKTSQLLGGTFLSFASRVKALDIDFALPHNAEGLTMEIWFITVISRAKLKQETTWRTHTLNQILQSRSFRREALKININLVNILSFREEM